MSDRWKVATNHKLCFRCLSDGHRGEACFKSRVCGIAGCRSHHHRMLHENSAAEVDPVAEVALNSPSLSASGSNIERESNQQTLKSTTGVSSQFVALSSKSANTQKHNSSVFTVRGIENCSSLPDQWKTNIESQCSFGRCQ